MLAAYFLPTMVLLLGTYAVERLRGPATPVGPSVRALSVTFSNTVQLGIPVVAALFGTAGLAIHIAIISLQALVLLTTATVLAEHDLGGGRSLGARLVQTVRRSVIHRSSCRSCSDWPTTRPGWPSRAWSTTCWPRWAPP